MLNPALSPPMVFLAMFRRSMAAFRVQLFMETGVIPSLSTSRIAFQIMARLFISTAFVKIGQIHKTVCLR